MMGYLFAMANEAEIIVDTDDDNIPKEHWGFPKKNESHAFISADQGFVNIYELYTKQKIWPRGYPLRHINKIKTIAYEKASKKKVDVGIWQGLADDDPDVDAVYRLTSNQECKFDDNGNYVLGKNTITPFNSQNTAFRKELFALLYLPSFVTFRFTDILRGLVAQPVMWLYGYHLGFTNATVTQKRNPHDYLRDFESEIPMYLNAEQVVELVSASITKNRNIADNLYSAYEKLHQAGIVCGKEMSTLEAWLTDYKKYV
jgi:hypothetical protein